MSCTPGSQAITGKASLVATMKRAYGTAASLFVPESFVLPGDYLALARAVVAAGPATPWVLKEDSHRGRGIAVLPPAAALAAARQRRPGGGAQRYVVAQRFVPGQLLVRRRPLYVRLWVLSLGTHPLRPYLFDGGVAVFGSRQGADDGSDGDDGDGVADGGLTGTSAQGADASGHQAMVVNLWQQDRAAARPWSLRQLWDHLDSRFGAGAATGAWARMCLGVAAALAAGLPAQREAGAALPGYQGGNAEVLGVDFLLDGALGAHLVEVNWLPSLARKVVACAAGEACRAGTREPFDAQKEAFLAAALRLLRASSDAATGTGPGRPPGPRAEQWRALCALRAEARAAEGAFVDLTRAALEALACVGRGGACAWVGGAAEGAAGAGVSTDPAAAAGGGARSRWAALRRLADALPPLRWGAAAAAAGDRAGDRIVGYRLTLLDRVTLDLARAGALTAGADAEFTRRVAATWARLAPGHVRPEL